MRHTDDRFDGLSRRLAGARSRREVVTLGVGAGFATLFGGVARAVAATSPGNSGAAHWCHENFTGRAAGQCTSQAAHHTGPYYQCGPGATTGTQGLCNGVCTDLTTAQNCGTCGNACPDGGICDSFTRTCKTVGDPACPTVPFCTPVPPDCPNVVQTFFPFGDDGRFCPGCKICTLTPPGP